MKKKSLIKRIYGKIDRMGFLNWMSDEQYLKIAFYSAFGNRLNLKNPLTFNEKLQWIKLYDRKPEYTTLVDKKNVKDYVAAMIGKEYIIPTLGSWKYFEDIDFEKLPNQFVLKCTHDSGGIYICRDKKTFDKNKAKDVLNKSLSTNYYYQGREWPYRDVEHLILAEKYLADNLQDYKFFCFNSVPRMILVCSERYSDGGLKEDFFDENWNHLDVERATHPNSDLKILPPHHLEEMKKLASKLSKNTYFSRIDFYEVEDKIYFGEITFFPSSGLVGFQPDEWDRKLGDWLQLPIRGE
ncbi:ATP-grasp fold amidoligase family protein [Clostridium sp. AF21-20LB]|jgi:hypothetical protein|uniref:ATP-grasp fold amidoligase family protein n=1 Tax=Clostridium sp. AF21-20LB TaxID=2293003 RepID=UPI000E4F6874|nr:glycosyl transferase [Clostridium sp. AF21-20LB]